MQFTWCDPKEGLLLTRLHIVTGQVLVVRNSRNRANQLETCC
jgi:hypothetical protein